MSITYAAFSGSLPRPFPFIMPQETSLLLLKPDCIAKNLAGEVLSRLQAEGFVIRGCKMIQLTDELLKDHYSHIADKPFFPDVATFMKSKPVIAVALAGENVISRVRDLLGPTDSKAAPKGTIRGDYGDDKMTNVVHASDSIEAAEVELKRFFAPGEVFDI
jgi:nucleoside-diphosphate kinase